MDPKLMNFLESTGWSPADILRQIANAVPGVIVNVAALDDEVPEDHPLVENIPITDSKDPEDPLPEEERSDTKNIPCEDNNAVAIPPEEHSSIETVPIAEITDQVEHSELDNITSKECNDQENALPEQYSETNNPVELSGMNNIPSRECNDPKDELPEEYLESNNPVEHSILDNIPSKECNDPKNELPEEYLESNNPVEHSSLDNMPSKESNDEKDELPEEHVERNDPVEHSHLSNIISTACNDPQNTLREETSELNNLSAEDSDSELTLSAETSQLSNIQSEDDSDALPDDDMDVEHIYITTDDYPEDEIPGELSDQNNIRSAEDNGKDCALSEEDSDRNNIPCAEDYDPSMNADHSYCRNSDMEDDDVQIIENVTEIINVDSEDSDDDNMDYVNQSENVVVDQVLSEDWNTLPDKECEVEQVEDVGLPENNELERQSTLCVLESEFLVCDTLACQEVVPIQEDLVVNTERSLVLYQGPPSILPAKLADASLPAIIPLPWRNVEDHADEARASNFVIPLPWYDNENAETSIATIKPLENPKPVLGREISMVRHKIKEQLLLLQNKDNLRSTPSSDFEILVKKKNRISAVCHSTPAKAVIDDTITTDADTGIITINAQLNEKPIIVTKTTDYRQIKGWRNKTLTMPKPVDTPVFDPTQPSCSFHTFGYQRPQCASTSVDDVIDDVILACSTNVTPDTHPESVSETSVPTNPFSESELNGFLGNGVDLSVTFDLPKLDMEKTLNLSTETDTMLAAMNSNSADASSTDRECAAILNRKRRLSSSEDSFEEHEVKRKCFKRSLVIVGQQKYGVPTRRFKRVYVKEYIVKPTQLFHEDNRAKSIPSDRIMPIPPIINSKPRVMDNNIKTDEICVLMNLPKVSLKILPALNKPIASAAIRFMMNGDTALSEHGINFALSALNYSTRQVFEFPLAYTDKRKTFRMKKKIEYVQESYSPPTRKRADYNTVESVVDDMITYVELKEIGNSIIREDPDLEDLHKVDVVRNESKEKTDASVTEKVTKIRGMNNGNRSLLQALRNLQVKIIDVNTICEDPVGPCDKPYCLMGCLCNSLKGIAPAAKHCQLTKCMFECTCSFKATDGCIQRLDLPFGCEINSTVDRLTSEATKNLAPREKDFVQTIIRTNSETYVVSDTGDRRRRSTRAPKKYEAFFETVRTGEEPPVRMKTGFYLDVDKLDLNHVVPFCMDHSEYECKCLESAVKIPPRKISYPASTAQKTLSMSGPNLKRRLSIEDKSRPSKRFQTSETTADESFTEPLKISNRRKQVLAAKPNDDLQILNQNKAIQQAAAKRKSNPVSISMSEPSAVKEPVYNYSRNPEMKAKCLRVNLIAPGFNVYTQLMRVIPTQHDVRIPSEPTQFRMANFYTFENRFKQRRLQVWYLPKSKSPRYFASPSLQPPFRDLINIHTHYDRIPANDRKSFIRWLLDGKIPKQQSQDMLLILKIASTYWEICGVGEKNRALNQPPPLVHVAQSRQKGSGDLLAYVNSVKQFHNIKENQASLVDSASKQVHVNRETIVDSKPEKNNIARKNNRQQSAKPDTAPQKFVMKYAKPNPADCQELLKDIELNDSNTTPRMTSDKLTINSKFQKYFASQKKINSTTFVKGFPKLVSKNPKAGQSSSQSQIKVHTPSVTDAKLKSPRKRYAFLSPPQHERKLPASKDDYLDGAKMQQRAPKQQAQPEDVIEVEDDDVVEVKPDADENASLTNVNQKQIYIECDVKRTTTTLISYPVFISSTDSKSSSLSTMLPPIDPRHRWLRIELDSHFYVLNFTALNYSITHQHLVDVAASANRKQATLRIRNADLNADMKHPSFGIYAPPASPSAVYVGPYPVHMEKRDAVPLEKLCIYNEMLITADCHAKLNGKPPMPLGTWFHQPNFQVIHGVSILNNNNNKQQSAVAASTSATEPRPSASPSTSSPMSVLKKNVGGNSSAGPADPAPAWPSVPSPPLPATGKFTPEIQNKFVKVGVDYRDAVPRPPHAMKLFYLVPSILPGPGVNRYNNFAQEVGVLRAYAETVESKARHYYLMWRCVRKFDSLSEMRKTAISLISNVIICMPKTLKLNFTTASCPEPLPLLNAKFFTDTYIIGRFGVHMYNEQHLDELRIKCNLSAMETAFIKERAGTILLKKCYIIASSFLNREELTCITSWQNMLRIVNLKVQNEEQKCAMLLNQKELLQAEIQAKESKLSILRKNAGLASDVTVAPKEKEEPEIIEIDSD